MLLDTKLIRALKICVNVEHAPDQSLANDLWKMGVERNMSAFGLHQHHRVAICERGLIVKVPASHGLVERLVIGITIATLSQDNLYIAQ